MQQHSSSAQHPPGQDTGSTTTTTVINGTADTPATIHRIVFTVSALLTLALIGFTLVFPGLSEQVLGHALAWVSDRFGWYYMLIVAAYGIFSLYVGMSKYGDIKLGQDHEKPDFPYLAWAAMLFSAGIGIDLLFFGVSEPLTHYLTPVTGQGGTPLAARAALAQTFLHWGLHGWGIYALIGMALAYFAYRHNLPLALRSALVPVFGQKRADGWLGHSVDIFGVVCTLLGLATSLGIGVLQANAGLAHVFGIETTKFTQAVIIIIVTVTAAASAMSGVDKGVRRLSEFNMLTAILLVIALLFSGPTQFLLNAMVQNIGDYFEMLPVKTFETYAYEGAKGATWKSTWTIFFWAWWVAWAPFVGLFIARISRGRTIREFIFGVLVIPSLFGVLWFTVFGNTAIWMDAHNAAGVLGSMTGTPEKLLFKFLEFLPMPALTGIVSLAVIALFFVTSADSGIYVLNNIASRDKSLSSPRWQAIMWGVLMSIVAVVLMREGGLGNLQTMTLIVALPFAMLMLLMCFSLWKGLNADRQYFSTKVHPSSVFWSGKNWHARLEQMMNQTQEEDILRFLKHTALPAMRELRQELTSKYGLTVQVNSLFDQPEPAVELVIQKESLRDFMYGIKSVKREVSEQLINDEHLPHIQHSVTYEPYTYFFDGRTGYDVQYMDHNELIADMLKQYERYLTLLGGVGQELMSHEQTDLAE